MKGPEIRWSDVVETVTLSGHPCLMYSERPRSVVELLVAARRWRDHTFIVHGCRRMTFAEHELAVAGVAGLMAAAGVEAGDRVGLFCSNCPEWSIAFFAAIELGAIAVPLNSWWSTAEVEHACAVVSPKLVVADERRERLLPVGVQVMSLDTLRDLAAVGSAPDRATVKHGRDEDENRPAVILFTSGTTGFPKGATLSHRSLIANLQNLLVVSRRLPQQLGAARSSSVTLTNLPLFHIGAIQLLLVPLVVGAKLVFPEGRFDPAEVLRLIEEEAVTTWSAVPTMVERLLLHPDLGRRNLTTVRTVVMGGAPVSVGLLDRVRSAFPNAGRGIGQAYGLSEAGGVLSTGVTKDLQGKPNGCVGRRVPVAEIQIDNPDADGIGEINARSPSVMDGYWGQVGDGGLTPEGWLRTGDLGWIDEDGFLYVNGRLKDMIIRGGENIAPAHIEGYLLLCEGVREAAVIGLPSVDLGEEVGAVVSIQPGAMVTPEGLRASLKPNLAQFEMPTRWWIVEEELPKTATGKIVKQDLRARWLTMEKS